MPVITYEQFINSDYHLFNTGMLNSYYEMGRKYVKEENQALYTEFGKYINAAVILSNGNPDIYQENLDIMDGFRDFLYRKDEDGITNYQKLLEIFPPFLQDQVLFNLNGLNERLDLQVDFNWLDTQIVNEKPVKDEEEFNQQLENNAIQPEQLDNNAVHPDQIVAVDYIRNLRDNAFTIFDPRKIPFEEKEEYMESFKDNILRIMAARMIANSERGKADKLRTTSFTNEELEALVDKMKEDRVFSNFLNDITKDPDLYKKAFLAATANPGHGGKLDDMFKEYMLNQPAGFMPNDKLHERYLPTAKERIESIQKQVANYPKLEKQYDEIRAKLRDMQENGGDEDEIVDAMAKRELLERRISEVGIKEYAVGEILALRNLVKAEFGKKESLDKKIPAFEENTLTGSATLFSEDYNQTVGNIAKSEETLRLLQEGHGGRMLQHLRDAVKVADRDINQEIEQDIKDELNKNTIDTYFNAVKDKAALKAAQIDQAIDNEDIEAATEAAKAGKLIINEYLLLTKEVWNKNLNTTEATLFEKDVPWKKIEDLQNQGENYDKDLMNSMKKFKPADIQNCLEFIKDNDPAGFVRHLNEKMVEVGNRKPAPNPRIEEPQANLGGHGMH